MKLNGIHHITAITGDAQRNVDFYAGVMGLRLVKKSVNQDDPTVYHLFYGDEHAKPGPRPDLLRVPRRRARPRGRGHDPPRRVARRLAGGARLLERAARPRTGSSPTREGDTLVFSDPEGLEHQLLVADVPDEPLDRRAPRGAGRARAPGLPRRARVRVRPRAQPRAAGAGPRLRAEGRRRSRRAATSAAASTSTTSRPPSAASRAPAPCTTSRGTRPTRTTRSGSSGRRARRAPDAR